MERRTFIKDTATYTALTMAGMALFQNKLSAETLQAQDLLLPPKNLNMIDTIPVYENLTTTVKLRGKDVKVHALCTGVVAVKKSFRTKKGLGQLAKLSIMSDHQFTEYMPIWVWVIEHPEGLITIDTGENSEINDTGKYLAKESSLMRNFFSHSTKFGVKNSDELNYQFDKVNLKTEDVKLVILTHLHLDHTDGLKFFPKQEIMVGEFEFKHPNANMPSTYPSWFKPNLLSYKKDNIDIFDQAYPITGAGDLLYVPTPGHTHGHSSVIFRTDDFDIFFAGDTSYYQAQIQNGELAGINADFGKSKDTYQKIMAYAKQRKTIYLPSHDGDAAKRLSSRSFLI